MRYLDWTQREATQRDTEEPKFDVIDNLPKFQPVADFRSVQLLYFMTSRPLKASHIKIEVKKKVEAAKRYTFRHAGCLSAWLLHHMHTH